MLDLEKFKLALIITGVLLFTTRFSGTQVPPSAEVSSIQTEVKSQLKLWLLTE